MPVDSEPFRKVLRKIAPQSKLQDVWPLTGGISAQMMALLIEDPDGQARKLVFRQPSAAALKHNPHTAQHEYRLLQITRSLGLPAPVPYALDASGEIFPTPYLVSEFIEGKPEFAPLDQTNFSIQFAANLAKIHSAGSSHLDLAFLPRAADVAAAERNKRPQKLNDALDEGRIRAMLDRAWPVPQHNPAVLLHGDYWPGNVLWQNGALVAVIDWEDAAFGDPLIDFAISRLDILWIFGSAAFSTFTSEYQSRMAVDTSHLPYWDLYAALRFIRLAGDNLAEWAAFFAPYGRHDITEQTIRQYYHFFITQAFEKLA